MWYLAEMAERDSVVRVADRNCQFLATRDNLSTRVQYAVTNLLTTIWGDVYCFDAMKPIEVYFLNCNRAVRFAMIVLLFFIASSATRLHAQGYGTISGTITDPTGAVVPSGNVTETQIQT